MLLCACADATAAAGGQWFQRWKHGAPRCTCTSTEIEPGAADADCADAAAHIGPVTENWDPNARHEALAQSFGARFATRREPQNQLWSLKCGFRVVKLGKSGEAQNHSSH